MVNIKEVFGGKSASREVATQGIDMLEALREARETALARETLTRIIKVEDMNREAQEVPVISSARANEITGSARQRVGEYMDAVERALEGDAPDTDTSHSEEVAHTND